jgi:hypothetical protein
MAGYQPATAAQAFERIVRGDGPHLAVGDFLDDWRRTPATERPQLIEKSIREPGDDPNLRRWAAFFAAMIEQLCWTNETGRLPRPKWTADPSYRLSEPWFLVSWLAPPRLAALHDAGAVPRTQHPWRRQSAGARLTVVDEILARLRAAQA